VLQAALVEEKTGAVKEYVAWRSLPRDLALRIKKHYSFYYTRRPAFDEIELLEGLSPSLRSEVTGFVLKETLGRLPLFAHELDPSFQMEVLPHPSRRATHTPPLALCPRITRRAHACNLVRGVGLPAHQAGGLPAW
jgi:hypothetical protein